MFFDKSLGIALLISIIFHTIIFLPLPRFESRSMQKDTPELKVTYLVYKKDFLNTSNLRKITRSLIAAQQAKKKNGAAINDTEKTKGIAEKIEIPPELPRDKENLYLNYYESIREKIRRFVINNYPHYIACGEVYLYFVLLSNGKLKELKIVEEKSSQNKMLKKIAKRSVVQASPFPAFPEDLQQSQLSFNVIISFELEDYN